MGWQFHLPYHWNCRIFLSHRLRHRYLWYPQTWPCRHARQDHPPCALFAKKMTVQQRTLLGLSSYIKKYPMEYKAEESNSHAPQGPAARMVLILKHCLPTFNHQSVKCNFPLYTRIDRLLKLIQWREGEVDISVVSRCTFRPLKIYFCNFKESKDEHHRPQWEPER